MQPMAADVRRKFTAKSTASKQVHNLGAKGFATQSPQLGAPKIPEIYDLERVKRVHGLRDRKRNSGRGRPPELDRDDIEAGIAYLQQQPNKHKYWINHPSVAVGTVLKFLQDRGVHVRNEHGDLVPISETQRRSIRRWIVDEALDL
jgi:hypothetical protein